MLKSIRTDSDPVDTHFVGIPVKHAQVEGALSAAINASYSKLDPSQRCRVFECAMRITKMIGVFRNQSIGNEQGVRTVLADPIPI